MPLKNIKSYIMKTINSHIVTPLIILLSLAFSLPVNAQTDDFVTTWRVAVNQTITIPTYATETYNYTVNWGDDDTDTSQSSNATHTYADAGTYTVRISGDFPRIHFDADEGSPNSNSIVAINQWGNQQWTSMRLAFGGATNLEGAATDRPDLSRVTDMRGMFRYAEKFNQYIGDWDVSNVENMGAVFEYTDEFNQDIGDWDVSNVINMRYMFADATAFNQDIGDWDVSNVTNNMTYMFARATAFNQDISGWDVRSVTDMASMFDGASDFSQNLGAWYISARNLGVDPTLSAGTEVTTITAQNSFLSGHNPVYGLSGDDAGLFALTAAGVLTITNAPPADKTAYRITITATGGSFGTDNHRDLTLPSDNKPQITSNGGVSTYRLNHPEGTRLVTTIIATDAESSDLSYRISDTASDRAFFEINNAGELRFKDVPDYDTPHPRNGGQVYWIRVFVSDGIYEISQQIKVTIIRLATPIISISTDTLVATVGSPIDAITIDSSGGGAVEGYSIAPTLPDGLTLDTATGTAIISGTPTAAAGLVTYVITATNYAGSATATVAITVNAAPQAPPSISISTNTLVATAGTTITPITIDETAGGMVSSYSISPNIANGLSFNTIIGTISGTPLAEAGSTTYVITATNSAGSATATVAITVNAAPQVPPSIRISTNTLVATVGTAIADITIISSGGVVDSYSIDSTLPHGLTLDTATGTISGTPTAIATLTTYTITATNTHGSAIATITITVNDVAPIISISTNTLVATAGTAIAPITIDSTGGMVSSYSISPNIANGLSFDTTTGTISGTPLAIATLTTYTITATNGVGEDLDTVTITVNLNTAPTDIALSSTTVASSATANRRVGLLSATDIDTDVHMYTLVEGDGDTDNALFIIDGSSLRIKDTPAAGSSSYNIRIQASDGTDDHSKSFVITVSDAPLSKDDFVTTWRVAANQNITIPTTGSDYNYVVNWGDGNTDMNQSGNATHTYANAGNYEVRIRGDFPRIYFNAGEGNTNSNRIIAIDQWGSQQWTSMELAFAGATKLEGAATDRPDLSRVTNMRSMFRYASKFNQVIGGWDVSNVERMDTLFEDAADFNQDIGNWDVSNVTNMASMFKRAGDFNQDISRWDVRGVTNMTDMFSGADAFRQNQSLGLWYISTRNLGVDPTLSAGAEVTRFTAQNAVLSGHNPVYSLSGDDAGLFTLNSALVLIINSAPSADKTSYRITISVGAGTLHNLLGGNNHHRDFILPSHNPPQITFPNGGVTPYSITLPENTQAVTTIMATDTEGASDFSYRLSDHDAAVFEINNAGELRFKAAYIPDYENPRDSQGNIDQSEDQEYRVNVFVFDGISEDMQQIRVTITPVDEPTTDIALSSTKVARDAPANRRVGLLSSNGVDEGETFVYTLVAGDGDADNALFTIDGTSLRIKSMPAAGSSSYNIRIQVSDGTLNYSKPFTITVGGDNPFSIDTTNFVTTWRVTAGQEITIPTHSSGTYSYTVDWEDGETDTETYNGNAKHTYTHPGDYEVRISGTFPRIYFNAGNGTDNSNSIIAINQWGNQQWTSMEQAFSGATKLAGQTTRDQPDLSRVTNMEGMFRYAKSFNQDIGDWDVSNVENMGITFEYTDDFNQYIGDWDVSNVTDMRWMFARATAFNQDISGWDVRGVTNMASMFFGNMDAFSQNLGAWYITTEDATVDPTLGAGAEVTRFTTQNSELDGHNPTYTLVGGADVGLFTLTSAGVLTINDVPPAGKTSYHITIAATGSFGTNNQQELTLVANHKPKITSNGGVSPYAITLPENTQAVTTITATDGDTDDTLTYTLSNDDAELFEINNAGELSFKAAYIPDYENPRDAQGNIDHNEDQEYSVLVSVSDGISPVTQQIRVTIVELLVPSISISTNTLIATVGIAITPIIITESGGVGGAVDSYSIAPPIENDLLFDTATGTISGTPTAIATLTTYTITATNRGGTDSGTITITVNGVPLTTPSISTTSKTVGPAEAASFLVSGTADAGSTVQLLRASTVIPGATATATANGSWTITVTLMSGTNIFSVIATDATENRPPSLPSRELIITLDNTAPIKPAISTATQATNTVSVTLEGVAEMGSIVQLLRSGIEIAGATTTATDGSWTITVTLEAGANTITATATDAFDNGPSNPSDPVIITLNNRAPVKVGTIDSVTLTLSVDESKTITVRNNFNDIDGDDLFYSATSDNPNIATATATSGSVTVTSVGLGAAIISVIANDGGGLTATQTFTVTVNDVAPIIMLSTDTLVATAGTTITPITIDETGGDVVSYGIEPEIGNGLSFSTATGTISGTPSMEAGSTTYVITATNSAGSATETVAITVNAAPQIPPSISISTNTLVATVGTAIADITITSSGGVVDSYSIDSILPHGLTLDTATGTAIISGTPTAIANLTTYTIIATNTHGSATATITITVNVAPLTTPSISTTSKTVGPAEAASFLVSGTADAGSIVNLYRGAGTDILGSTTATTNGSWTITVTLITEPNIFTAIATDAAGNGPSNPSDPVIITLDSTKPGKPAISTATQVTNTVSVTLEGSAESDSIVQLLRSGIEIAGATTTATNGSWTITVTLEVGANTITATATDAFDNGPSNPSDPVIITRDSVAPTVLISSAYDGRTANTRTLSYTAAFDEAVSDFDASDITVTGTAISGSPVVTIFSASADSTTYTFNVVATTDGSVTVSIAAEAAHDSAGNGNTASSAYTLTIDSTAPAVSITTNTPQSVNTESFTLTGTADADSTVQLLRAGTVILGATATATNGAWTITVTLVPGVNTITATATDNNGNTSDASNAVIITLDTGKPEVAITTTAQSVNTDSFTLTGTAEVGSTVNLLRGAGTESLGSATATNGAWTITVTLRDGANTITATATDRAGNTSDATDAVIITLDTGKPEVAITTTAQSVNTDSFTLTGTAEVGSTVNLLRGAGTESLGSATATNGAWTITVTLRDGANTITATATDRAGNTSDATDAVIITLDTGKPEVAITTTAQSVNTDSFTLTGTAEVGSTVNLLRGAGTESLGSATATNGAWTITVTLRDGANTITATATDRAGNTSDATDAVIITLDTGKPEVAITTTAQSVNTDSFTLTGTAEVGSTVNLLRGAGTESLGSATATNGAWTITVTLRDGANTITATATDRAGNTSDATDAVIITLDTGKPEVAITTTAQSVNTDSFTLTGTAEVGSTVNLLRGAGTESLGSATATNGAWTITVTLRDGANTITATATDRAGNTSDATDAVIITLDTGKPEVAITTTAQSVNTDSFTLTGTAEVGSTVNLLRGAGTETVSLGSATATNGAWTITVTLRDGANTLTATATDRAGNTSDATDAVIITLDTGKPEVAITTTAQSVNTDSFTLTGTAEVGSTVNLLRGAGTETVSLGSATATNGAWTITVTLRDGANTLTATATDRAGNTSDATDAVIITLDSNAPIATPSISISTDTLVATVGSPIDAITIDSSGGGGGAVEGYSIAPTLPDGLTLDTATGTAIISGTPTAIATLTTYTITATNSGGTDSRTITITVNAAPTTPTAPIISISTDTLVATVGSPIDAITIDSSGGGGGAVEGYSIAPTLPDGLTLDTATGTAIISGTPTAIATLTTYTITATNVTGADTATVNITVNAVPTAPMITYMGGVTSSNGTRTIIEGFDPYVANVNPSSNIDEDFLQRAEGTIVVDTITATSSEGSSIEYFLPTPSGDAVGDNDLFEIDSSSGVLSFKSSPDYEYPLRSDGTKDNDQIYWAIVQVRNSGTDIKSEALLIQIEITNINLDVSISASSGGVTETGSTDTHTVALTVTKNAEVTLSSVVHSYDPTEGGVTHTWTQVAGETVALDDASAATVTFRVPDQITETLTLSFLLTVSDDVGSDTVVFVHNTATITVTPAAPSVAVPSISISTDTLVATVGSPIDAITIDSSGGGGGAVEGYSIAPTLPDGLTLDTATGTAIISGTPTAIATLTTYTITATNSGGTDSRTITITVNAAPTTPTAPIISISTDTLVATVGSPIDAITIDSNGGAVESYSIDSALPDGLTLDTATGTAIISGTPTAIATLTTYTITATNSGGTDSRTITITVNEAPTPLVATPIISISTNTLVATVGSPIDAITIDSSGGGGGAVEGYSIAPTLPDGLTLDTATGTAIISGTPTAIATLTTYTITATNSGGTDSRTITITVNAAPTPPVATPIISISTDTLVATVGSPIDAITIDSSGGGGAVEGYSIAPTLPDGLTLDTATGTAIISGTPTAIATLTTYTITATNSGGTDSRTITITVNAAPTTPTAPIISISTDTLVATVGSPIDAITIDSSGGGGGAVEGYSIAPTLPDGLTLDTATGTAIISGTPTAIATLTTYTITATNSGGTDSRTITITVNAAPTTPTAPIISISTDTLVATVGSPIDAITIDSSGGGGAVEGYSIAPTLPDGLALDETTGTISGTPTAVAGPATYTITATNVTGADTATVNITVNEAPPPPIITYRGGIANSDGTATATGHSVYVANVNPASNDIDEDFLQRAEGTSVVDTITATNDGSRSIEYFLPTPSGSVLGDNNLFEIDSSSGVLSFRSPPDYEYPLNSDGTTQGANQIYWAIVQVKISGTDIKSELLLIKVEITNIDLDVSISASSGGVTETGSTDTHTVALTVDQGAEVTLSSVVHSYDPTEGGVTQTWTQVAGETVALDDASAATVTFRVPDQITETLTLSFLLTVSDDGGSDTAVFVNNTATITVTPSVPAVAVPSISISPNTLVATVGTAITPITISSSGGDVISYSISSTLTTGLSFNTATGTISGTPTAVASLATYTITATNTRGSDSTTIAITVNPATTVNKKVEVSAKIITVGVGSKTITVESRTIQVEVATGEGGDEITRFDARDVSVSELQMIANKAVTGGIDLIDEPSIDSTITPTLVVNTVVDITVNERACPAKGCEVTLSYEASDEQAGKDLYVFHYDGEKWEALPHVRRGTNTVTALADSFSPFALFNASAVPTTPVAVPSISISPNTLVATVGTAIQQITIDSSGGGNVVSYSIAPAIGNGLSFSTATGTISGTPTTVARLTTYTITATNTRGSDSATIAITVNASAVPTTPVAVPSISISPNTLVATVGTAIQQITIDSSGGGNVVSYSIAPAIGNGLSFSTATGTISGTPTTVARLTTYTITATNATGSAVSTVAITVNGADKLAKQLQADNKQLNKDILPILVQTMLASTMSAVSTRIDATFSGKSRVGSYQLDGQTVKLNGSGNLQDAMANKLPRYAKSLKDGTMDWKAMLSRSSFVLPLNAVDGDGATAGGATVWGNSEYSLVSDKGWKGDVFSLQLGVDQRMKDDLLVGGLVSWSKGDVDYTQDNKSGDYTHQITSVHPYLAWSIDDVRLWSSAGYGQGELSKKDRNGNERRSDTHLLSLSAGVSGRLSQFGQSNLNLKSDMVLAQTNIDGSADNIPADSLASQRLRLLLEIDRELQLASGGRFHPLIEIGLRYDGGGYDAGVGNSGIGAVLGFGGRYANTGLTVEGKFHTLVGRKDYKEWGVQGTIRKTSANDQGLTFSLIPSYGATGNSANQVWKQKLSDGNKSNGDYQARLDVNVGYGLFTGGGLLTPYSELRMGKNNRYRLGLRWKPNSPFSLHLYGERKTSNDSDRILLETNIRF